MVDLDGIVDDGLNKALGLRLDEAGPDRVVMSWTVGPQHLQPYGIVHGGVYCSVVESSASIGAVMKTATRTTSRRGRLPARTG